MITLNDFKMVVSKLATITMVLLILIIAFSVNAESINTSWTWDDGNNVGQQAQTCIQNIPDNRPLALQKTLVIDKNLPVGAEIYSWGYGDFLPNFSISCTVTGTNNSWFVTTPTVGATSSVQVYVMPMMTLSSGTTYATNVAGVGIKLYYSYQQERIYCSSSSCNSADVILNQPINSTSELEFANGSYSYSFLRIYLPQLKNGSYGADLAHSPVTGSFSIRAELVKTGDIDYDKNIDLASIGSFLVLMTGNDMKKSDLLDGSGIKIVAPACQLKTKNYFIDLHSWENTDPQGSIIVGNPEPVNLDLECSGEVANVRFKFEDVGADKLSNNNIRLYQSISGTDEPIDGLEVELLYNNTHVDVDNTTTVNTGNYGSARTSPSSIPIFNSSSTVNFSARYIQRASITSNGHRYAGPVTGKVNMWVTYD